MPSPTDPASDSTVRSYLYRGRYHNPDLCARDVLLALKHYRGLKPKYEKFVFNDGRSREFLCLDGTIPVPYRGTSYNIPICVWILDTHPQHAPLCYVKPTPDMQIKVSANVDHHGKVYLPYLSEWNHKSEILSLIQLCIITFSDEPPVFSRPQQQQQQPLPYPQAQPASAFPPAYPPSYPTRYQQPTPYPPMAQNGTISQEHLRASLQSAVEDKIRRSLADDYTTKQVEIQCLQRIQQELNAGQQKLNEGLEKLDEETRKVRGVCDALKVEKENLEDALAKLDRDQESSGHDRKGPEDKIVTVTPIFKQIADCYAEELALTDAIYYLSEALRRGIIDCDVFLKLVRDLSRKQFFLTATIQKAREKAGLSV